MQCHTGQVTSPPLVQIPLCPMETSQPQPPMGAGVGWVYRSTSLLKPGLENTQQDEGMLSAHRRSHGWTSSSLCDMV